MSELIAVLLARSFLAGGESMPLYARTTVIIARAFIELHEEMEAAALDLDKITEFLGACNDRVEEHLDKITEFLGACNDWVEKLFVELADTQRERNRNREYVGECLAIVREIFDTVGKGNYDSTIKRLCALEDRVFDMAYEVGK